MQQRFLLLLFIFNFQFSIFNCFAQDPDIRSVQCFVGNNELSDPIMELNGTEQLTLWFDDLNEQRSFLNYTVVHCNADWQEDGLFVSDYLDGFDENPLRDYLLSFQTRVNYLHYELRIPNDDIRLKVSGNYLLKVYESDKSKPILTCRFSLYENSVEVPLRVRSAIQTGERCLQQLEFSVKHQALPVRDAYKELKVRVMQNGFLLPWLETPVPFFIDKDEVSYTFATKNFYPGGNEFRSFDIRTLEFGAKGIQQVRYDEQGYPYALLNKDTPRESQPYIFYNDINGKFRVEAYRTHNRQIEAEYVATGFTLQMEELQGSVYVFGELSDRSLQPAFKMNYDNTREAYTLNILLKQAYYNYRYLYVDEAGKVDLEAIEGCFSETENYYTILVYYRSVYDKYDRLVGMQSVNTL